MFGLAKSGEGIIRTLTVVIGLYKKTSCVVIDGNNLSKFIKECVQFGVMGFKKTSSRSGSQMGLTDNIMILCGPVQYNGREFPYQRS